MKHLPFLLALLLFPSAFLHGQMKDAEAPTLGRRAPWLIHTNADLLQAPPGAQPNWRSLHDKVVVVEFLCTWSSDCVAEIPALNRLADSLDTSKVQFIAVDEDNPGYLQAYLAKHPITGWIIPDSSRLNGRSWGVGPLPTIFVIDTEGNVVLMTLHPEHIRRDALLTLANGENVALESDADAKADAETWQAIKDAQQAQARYDSTAEPRFSISITPGPPAAYPGSPGAVAHGGNQFVSVSGATPDNLLIYTFGIQPDQVKINGALPKTGYNLSLRAPSLDDPRLVPVVDQAIEFNCGVKIERHTSTQDVYVLKAMDHARLQQGLELPHGLGGQYSYTFGSMRLEFSDAGPGIMAEGLEQVLNRPVVNESGVEGNVTATLTFPATDFDAVRSALEKSTGFTLIPAKRPIESITITPNPQSSPPSANPIQ